MKEVSVFDWLMKYVRWLFRSDEDKVHEVQSWQVVTYMIELKVKDETHSVH